MAAKAAVPTPEDATSDAAIEMTTSPPERTSSARERPSKTSTVRARTLTFSLEDDDDDDDDLEAVIADDDIEDDDEEDRLPLGDRPSLFARDHALEFFSEDQIEWLRRRCQDTNGGPTGGGTSSSGSARRRSTTTFDKQQELGSVYLHYHRESQALLRQLTESAQRGTDGAAYNPCTQHLPLDDDGAFRRWWDGLSLVFTGFLLLFEPWVLAFTPTSLAATLDAWREFPRPSESHKLVVGVRVLSTFWFAVDMALSCVTSYADRSGRKVVALPKIATRYAITYLAADLACTVPWEVVALAACGRQRCAGKRRYHFALSVVPFARAFKLSKCSKAVAFFERVPGLSDLASLPPYVDHFVFFVFLALFLNHCFGCVWIALGRGFRSPDLDAGCVNDQFAAPLVDDDFVNSEFDDPDELRRRLRELCTWMQRGGYHPHDSTRSYLYFTAFYWSLTTLTTVGYGDITPNTSLEKAYACCVMFAGAQFFAQLISSLGSDFFPSDTDGPSSSSSSFSGGLGGSSPIAAAQNTTTTTTGGVPISSSDVLLANNHHGGHHRRASYSKASQKRIKKQLKAFLYKHRVGYELSSAITAYLRRHFEVDQPWVDEDAFPDVARLVHHLNKPLLRALALHVYKRKHLGTIPFFDDKPPQFIADAVIAMRSYVAAPSETVVHAGTIVRAIHLIVGGSCVASLRKMVVRKKKPKRSDGVHGASSDDDDADDDDDAGGATSAVRRGLRRSLGVVDLVAELAAGAARNGRRVLSPTSRHKKHAAQSSGVSDDDAAARTAARTTALEASRRLWRLDAGAFFGEEGIILGAVWTRPLVASSWCELNIVPDAALGLDNYPDLERDLRRSAHRKVRRARAVFYVVAQMSTRHLDAAASRERVVSPLASRGRRHGAFAVRPPAGSRASSTPTAGKKNHAGGAAPTTATLPPGGGGGPGAGDRPQRQPRGSASKPTATVAGLPGGSRDNDDAAAANSTDPATRSRRLLHSQREHLSRVQTQVSDALRAIDDHLAEAVPSDADRPTKDDVGHGAHPP